MQNLPIKENPLMRKILIKYLKLIVFILIIYFLYIQIKNSTIDLTLLKKLSGQIESQNIGLVLFGIGGTYLTDALLSKVLLKVSSKNLTLKDTLKVAVVDVFATQVLPLGQAGGMATVFYFYKLLEVTNNSIVFLITTWPVFTMLPLIIFGLISFWLYRIHPPLNFKLNYSIPLIVIALILFLVFSSMGRKFITKVRSYIESKIGKIDFKKAILDNVIKFRHFKFELFICILLGFIYFFFQTLTLFGSLQAFGVKPGFWQIVFVISFTQLIRTFSFVPGGLGFVESALLLILGYFGFDTTRSLAGIILYRTFNFWLPLIVGFIVYWQFVKSKRVLQEVHPKSQSGSPRRLKDL